MNRCSKHVVGYIDLLGAKEKIHTDPDFYLYELEEIIFFVKEVLNIDDDLLLFDKIKFKAFSDNIVFAVEINESTSQDSAFLTIFTMCSYFQRMLIQECDWFSRGAITIGDFYIDENIVWGKALIRAYELESSIAIFPRVILDPQILYPLNIDKMSPDIKQLIFNNLECDNDGFFFVDYTMKGNSDISKFLDHFEKICDNVDTSNSKIWQKIYWIRNYIKKKRDQLGL